MLRLIMRECHQCGFEQSEFSLKTVDISVPEVEREITGGPRYTVIGAEVVARKQKEESPGTASNSDYAAAIENIREILDRDMVAESKIASINIIVGALDYLNRSTDCA